LALLSSPLVCPVELCTHKYVKRKQEKVTELWARDHQENDRSLVRVFCTYFHRSGEDQKIGTKDYQTKTMGQYLSTHALKPKGREAAANK